MKWFYSGSGSLDEPQMNPEKSLGGFRSSTVVPNGRINSMFNDFSSLAIQENKVETKAFFIKNTFSNPVRNILVYATYPENPYVDFQLAAVEGNEMEKLSSSNDIPYYSEFFDFKVVFSYTDLIVKPTFQVGETVIIEGVEIPVHDGKVETFITNAVKAFSKNLRYKAVQLDTNVLRLEYRLLGVYTNQPEIATYNAGTIVAGTFGNGFDNSQLISEELKPGESIGIFLKREPKGYEKTKTLEDYKELLKKFVDSGYQKVQNADEKFVNICFEWTDVK